MAGAPTGAIEGPVQPGPASPGAGSVVTTAGTAAAAAAGLAAGSTGPVVGVEVGVVVEVVVVLGTNDAVGPVVPMGSPAQPLWLHRRPQPSDLWPEYVSSRSAICTEAPSLAEGGATVVVGGSTNTVGAKLVVGAGTLVVGAGTLVVGAGTLVVGAGTLVVGAGTIVVGAGTLEARGTAATTCSSAASAGSVVGDAAMVGTGAAGLGPAASNRLPLAASRSSRNGAGESRAERARKVVVDAEVSPRLACCRASGAAIRAWWTAWLKLGLGVTNEALAVLAALRSCRTALSVVNLWRTAL